MPYSDITKRRACVKSWSMRNPDKLTSWRFRRRYGILLQDYTEILKKQKGLCAICGQSDFRKLSVDHCHNTNKVRGLLCMNCNAGLGMFRDNPMMLVNAIDYLVPEQEVA